MSDIVNFHGYKVHKSGVVVGKNGKPLKLSYRERRGGKLDARVCLYINGKGRHFTLQRLVASCFLGPIYGYQINHKDRNTLNNNIDNLERVTPSQNQKHWRDDERRKCKLSK